MKLIIDVPNEVYEALKGIAEDTTSLDPYSLADIIVNKSKPYEERPHGKWLRTALYGNTCLECNQCGKADFDIRYYDFCPKCGADMRGAE